MLTSTRQVKTNLPERSKLLLVTSAVAVSSLLLFKLGILNPQLVTKHMKKRTAIFIMKKNPKKSIEMAKRSLRNLSEGKISVVTGRINFSG